MLIDFHTHIFPEAIAARSIAALESAIRQIQGEDYRKGEPLTCRPATLDGLLSDMQRTHVDRSVCLPIATKPSQTATINRYAETVRSERALSFGTLHPADPAWETVLEDLKQRGFCGIKLHLQFQQFYIDSPEVLHILQKAEQLDLLVIFHAGDDIGLPPPVYAPPERIRHALDYVSGKNLIAAHLGGWEQWDEVEKYLVGTPIMLDTAFISQFIDPAQCVRIIRNHGAEKILFGSDSPWESPADTLRFLTSLGLTEKEMSQITHENALRLLGSHIA
ncbi:MAG: amidohydrolase family protein [Oscillospiraceae bacterium]|nr:amidohydrolase family protein [Oscillospiraceae bacterium]MBQ9908145.1 amidohydrolase family protein [Oscillospiraceae bacterium]